MLLTLPHAREVLLEVLTIDSNRKLDAVQFLEHVRIPRLLGSSDDKEKRGVARPEGPPLRGFR